MFLLGMYLYIPKKNVCFIQALLCMYVCVYVRVCICMYMYMCVYTLH